ncbi:MAG: PEP-CTERM sorting domain-containing protein [Aulosira sp. DedQUE10]|nr:PEP-CTERM sorting domain-containing protein [Aulosira sp. DedQUE10]
MLISANPASAVSLVKGGSTPVTGEGQYTNIQGATTINFNNGIAPTSGLVSFSSADGSISNNIVQGSVSNVYATPYNDTSKYLSVSPDDNVTINFAQALDYFGFYWGSIDTYNSVDVYSKGALVKTFTGADVPGAPADGAQSGDANNVYVNLLANSTIGETFDKIVLKTTSPAFETDNYSYRVASVPEPSSILGLLAFGAMSAGSLVKRKSKVA